MIRETGNPFGDRAHILYVNGENVSRDTALGRLMHDFQCANAADIYSNYLRGLVDQYKNPSGGAYMRLCNELQESWGVYADELIAESEARGEARGRAEERSKMIVATLKSFMASNLVVSAEDVLRNMNVPESEWQHYIDLASK